MLALLSPRPRGTSIALDSTYVTRVWDDAWLEKDPVTVIDMVLADMPEFEGMIVGPDVPVDVAANWFGELQARSSVPAVFVGPATAAEIVRLTRLGATDFLETDDDGTEWSEMLDRTQQAARRLSASPSPVAVANRGRLVVFTSPRGGTGRTTMAINLANALAAEKSVVLVDLDLEFGDVAITLGLEPELTMFDAAEMVRAGTDPVSLRIVLDRAGTGTYVLAAPKELTELGDVQADEISTILTMLLDHFEFVIVDTSSGLPEAALAALAMASDIVQVATPTPQSIHGLRRSSEAFDLLGLGAARHLLVNMTEPRAKDMASIMEETLSMQLLAAVPRSRQVGDAMQRDANFYRPGSSRDVVSRAFDPVVHLFGPELVPEPRGRRRKRR